MCYNYNITRVDAGDGADCLRWLEERDDSGRLEHEGLVVSEDWRCQRVTEHSVRATRKGREIFLDFMCLELERDGEEQDVWAFNHGFGFEVFLDAAEAMNTLEEIFGCEFLEPLGDAIRSVPREVLQKQIRDIVQSLPAL